MDEKFRKNIRMLLSAVLRVKVSNFCIDFLVNMKMKSEIARIPHFNLENLASSACRFFGFALHAETAYAMVFKFPSTCSSSAVSLFPG